MTSAPGLAVWWKPTYARLGRYTRWVRVGCIDAPADAADLLDAVGLDGGSVAVLPVGRHPDGDPESCVPVPYPMEIHMSEKTTETSAPETTAPAFASVAEALLDEARPLAELQQLVPESEIARAWVAGEIEFGRRTYCVAGGCGPASGPNAQGGRTLIVEGQGDAGISWTGERQRWHQSYKQIAAEKLPVYERYQKYVPITPDAAEFTLFDEQPYGRVGCTRAEAEALLVLQVRLTDRGLAKLRTPVAGAA